MSICSFLFTSKTRKLAYQTRFGSLPSCISKVAKGTANRRPVVSIQLLILAMLFCGVLSVPCDAQTSEQKVINAPPVTIGDSVGISSNTTVNVYEGGVVGNQFSAGRSYLASSNIFVNVYGGSIGFSFDAFEGSTVNISGGRFGAAFRARSGGSVSISGGSFGDSFETRVGSTVEFAGDNFRINGELVPGLSTVGDSQTVDIPQGAIFTGTFADGTPFAFTHVPNTPFSDGTSRDLDKFANGTLTLTVAQLPQIAVGTIDAAIDPIPLGIRAGQTLNVGSGSAVPDNFLQDQAAS